MKSLKDLIANLKPIENVECCICYDVYTRDALKYLPCNHSYCFGCVSKLFKIESMVINCPLCRKEHDISSMTVEDIKELCKMWKEAN